MSPKEFLTDTVTFSAELPAENCTETFAHLESSQRIGLVFAVEAGLIWVHIKRFPVLEFGAFALDSCTGCRWSWTSLQEESTLQTWHR